ncbi:hypothetical protein ACMDCR_13825 [Labrys okinawensis]|uniref:hypothetical protein n=1 Tax=Labrys okinawensis TaxID=346911 RepID=UPI0039BCAB36
MEFCDFTIGLEFYTEAGKWRCTDVGTRTISAIRLDKVSTSDGHTLAQADAEAEGWFDGPPYAAAEECFDEHDFEGCSLVAKRLTK